MNPTDQARQHAFQQTLLSARRTMLLSEILKLAIDSFRASKMRFALTALGMVIGTASVILVVTIGMTGKHYILQELQKIETNSVELEYSGGGATAAERILYNDSLTREDEKAVVAQLPGVLYSSPVLTMHDRISFGGGVVRDTLVLGVSPQYRNIRNLLVPVGRFLDETDDEAHIKCAVVTEKYAIDRFGSDEAAVGQRGNAAGRGAHERPARRHRLRQDHWQRLAAGGKRDHARLTNELLHLLRIDRATDLESLCLRKAKLGGRPDDDALGKRAPVGDHLPRLLQHISPLS